MYWSFPGISARDRLQRAPALDPARITVSPEQAFAALSRDHERPRKCASTQLRRPTCLPFRRGGRRDGMDARAAPTMVYADDGTVHQTWTPP